MTGWSVCPLCRAVVWRDALARTFGHSHGCSNAKYMSASPSKPPATQLSTDKRGVFAQRPGKPQHTPYSVDARGDCRPVYELGTGNFTISQAARFPATKKPLGSDGDYDAGLNQSIGARTAPTRKAISPAFKDNSSKMDADWKSKYHTPDKVGPSTYLKHNSWLEGVEQEKVYSWGGSSLRSKTGRDVYGRDGLANLGLVMSPKRINSYIAHDHEREWRTKTTTSNQAWCTKGKSMGRSSRFHKNSEMNSSPGPGEYHGLLSNQFSSLNTKIIYRDPDAISSHRTGADRPLTGPT